MVPTGELSRQEGGTITQRSAHSLGSSDGNGDGADGAADIGDRRSLGWVFLGA